MEQEILLNINTQMQQGWGPKVAIAKAGYSDYKVTAALKGTHYKTLRRLIDFYNYYRKITPLDQPLPDFFKGRVK